MKERLVYIDILRAFAIFLVTLGHVTEYGGYGQGLLHGVIYSFHMPLFFAISGFVAMYGLRGSDASLDFKGFLRYAFKKFRFILIPYLVWGLVVHPFCFSMALPSWEGYLRICRSVFCENTSAWFLPCLFGLSLALGIHRLLFDRICVAPRYLVDVAGVIMLYAVLGLLFHVTGNPFLRSVVSYYLPFMVGVVMGKHSSIGDFVEGNQWVFIFSVVVFAVSAGVFAGHCGTAFEKPARLMAGLTSIPVFFSLARCLNLPNCIVAPLVLVGQNTLSVYCLQNWGRIPSSIFAPFRMTVLLQVLVFGAISVFVITLIVAVAGLLSRNVILRQLLFGKR